MAPVVFDALGNLYGTTEFGGEYGYGTIYKLSPNGSGGWVESAVHVSPEMGMELSRCME